MDITQVAVVNMLLKKTDKVVTDVGDINWIVVVLIILIIGRVVRHVIVNQEKITRDFVTSFIVHLYKSNFKKRRY